MHKLQITYDQLLEAIQEGIWVIDADSITTYVNKKMADLLGYTVDEMIGKHLFDFIDDEELAYVESNINRRRSGISETHESRFKHKEGYDVFVEVKTTPVTDDQGNYIGAIASATDITTLKKRERLHQTIVDNIPDIVIKYDKAGVYLDIIAPGEEKLFVPKKELLGKKISDVLPEEVSDIFMKSIKDALSTSEMKVCEYQLKVPEGLLYFEAHIVPGDSNNVYAFIRDITERRQADQKLQFQAEILDSIGDLVTATDPDGRILYVNEAECRKLGQARDELIGKTTAVYGEDPDHGALQKEIVETTNEQGFWRGEVVNYDRDNNPIYLDCRTWAMRDTDGDIHTLVGVSTDITERKKAEKQIEKLAHIADSAPCTFLVHDYKGNIFYANERAFLVYGYEKEEFMKLNLRDIHAPESAELIKERIKEIEEKGEAEFEIDVIRKDGFIFPMQVHSKQTEWFGEPAILGVATDLSERKKAEKIILESEQRLIQAQKLGKFGDFTWDVNTGLISWSAGLYDLLGYDESEEIDYAKVNKEIHHPDDLERITKWLKECIESGSEVLTPNEYRVIRKDKKEIYVHTSGIIERDKDNQIKVFATLQDITERKEAEEKIKYISLHDQLTDLYNRHYFESCKEDLKEIPQLSVIMTDINGLKLINDTYGHKVGDELLKNYADLLRKSFKQSDLIFRWGGDEFIIILKDTKEVKSWEICNRLIKHCGETFVKDIPLSISVGISSKLQGEDIDKAIQEAEDMMYKNKLTESKSSKNLIMKTLLQTLSEKSFETKGHIDRMTTISKQFGEKIGLSPSELSRLEALAMLHDVGKINIDSHILLKEPALTDEEWEEIKKHPEVGYRITRTTEEFAYIANEILAHHERWDGKGYPQGLEGEDIPYLARILTIIDSFDVMSNGRPYKKNMTAEEIIEEIEICSGKQFDPDLAEEFVGFLRRE